MMEELKKAEEEYKAELMDMMDEMSLKQAGIISEIEKLGEFLSVEKNLPNFGITLHNKMGQMEHELKKVGIPMYSSRNFLGDAIIYDLTSYIKEGTKRLREYADAMNASVDEKTKPVTALEKGNPIIKFFRRLKHFFVPIDLFYTPEETQSLNTYLSAYKEIDNRLWNYNLRDNVVSSITKRIRMQRYASYTVPDLVGEYIAPDLEKLGLADLIPKLQESLVEEYKRDLPDFMTTEENMHLFVPNFSQVSPRKDKDKDEVDESGMKNGVGLEDLSFVAKTITASERQEIVEFIKKMQSQQEKEETIKEESSDVSLE